MDDLQKAVNYAIGIICSYVCSDSNYDSFIRCKISCVDKLRELVEDMRQKRVFR